MSLSKFSLAIAAGAALAIVSAAPGAAQYITKRGVQSYAPETTKRTQGPPKVIHTERSTTQQRGSSSSSSSSRSGSTSTHSNGMQTQRR